ncbi:uncharacterized protein TNCV_3078911 [Trichonephila clavipes]|nr:uncharacterized protein TNCV_3078911 [Trichonephila clavipes]
MSDISDFMDFSPTRQSKVAACEKLRDTVHSISAMHSSISEGARTPTKKNSFLELYQMTSYDLAKKKDELVSELKTLPPCTRDDCKEHKIPPIVEDSNVSESTLDKTNHNVKKKKQNKKRKNRTKESSEEFIFPKKTARPVSPISTQDPIETKNNFSDLEQDVEHPLPTNEIVISETITPPTKPPYPVMLKIKDNFRDQMKLIINKFPNLRNRIVVDVVKMFSNDHEERRSLIQFLKTDIDFEFYVIDVKKDKPIKAIIKGLPNSSKTDDITSDLADVAEKEPPFGDPKKKRNLASKWIKEGISFANVVSGEVPNQIPIDDKKEDSPHGFLSQDSNNTSDLTQVLELFQIFSNLVKKNPKILDLLTKFKKANSDEEKTCLLAEAIMDKV